MDISKYMIYMNNINAFNVNQKKQLVIDSINEAIILTNAFKTRIPFDIRDDKKIYNFDQIFKKYMVDSGYPEYYEKEHKDSNGEVYSPDVDTPGNYKECGPSVDVLNDTNDDNVCYIYSNTLLNVLDIFTLDTLNNNNDEKHNLFDYFNNIGDNVFSFDKDLFFNNEGGMVNIEKEEEEDEDGNKTGKIIKKVYSYFFVSYIPHYNYIEPKDELVIMGLIEMILRKKTLMLVPNQFTPNMIQILDNEIKKQVYMVSKQRTFINEINYRNLNNYN